MIRSTLKEGLDKSILDLPAHAESGAGPDSASTNQALACLIRGPAIRGRRKPRIIRRSLQFLLAALLGAMVFPAQAVDPTRTIRMDVAGLVCGFCAQGIDKQMRTFEATRDVYVNLEPGVVAVELDPGADSADAVLDKALTDAGYTLTGITRVERPLVDVRREVEDGSR